MAVPIFSSNKKYPIPLKPATAADEARTYQDIFNIFNTLRALFQDLDQLTQELVPEAPKDGEQYARQDGEWTVVEGGSGGIPDAPVDGQTYGRNNAAWVVVSGGTAAAWGSISGDINTQNDLMTLLAQKLGDAPQDSQLYARRNGTWDVVPSASAATWGTISGNLQDQTDLYNALTSLSTALAGKEDSITAGGSAQYWRGDKTWANLTWGVIAGKPNFATVATSGSYDDLSNKPTILPDAPANGTIYGRQNNGWVPVPTGGGGGSLVLNSATVAAGNNTLGCGKVASITKCVSTAPARIRLYCTAAGRTADASRPIGTQAANNVGLILEFVAATGILGAELNPVPTAHNGDTPVASVVYAAIEATSGTTPSVTFNFVTLVA